MSAEANATPLVWILTGDKAGDNAQLRNLAQAAGLAFVEKKLEFNGRRRRANILLGATVRSVRKSSRPLLVPPWPDLLLSSGRRSVPAARWIKRQSGGRTKLVHLGRPWGRMVWFDLVLAMPQYDGLPGRPNVFRPRMPFNRADAEGLERAAVLWRERFAKLPRPWIGLLVGGTSKPLYLDLPAARAMGRFVSQKAQSAQGSVIAVTSRRTGAEATAALFEAIEAPALCHAWSAENPENPYLAILALADELVVTADSASMLAEALRTGKPVSIAPLTRVLGHRRRRMALLKRVLPKAAFEFFVDLGFFTRTRDLIRLHDKLLAENLVSVLPAPPPARKLPFDDDLAKAAWLVRTLIGAKT